jgi:hypothetical protein
MNATDHAFAFGPPGIAPRWMLVLAPLFHRILHKFHMDDTTQKDE